MTDHVSDRSAAAPVIIPAHDEAAVIAETLRVLLLDAQPGELDVVVVCNGCTDETADVVRSVAPDVTVIETPLASKVHALNLGDEAVRGFPRVYLDGDVRIDTSSVRRLIVAIERGCLAASPMLVVDTARSSWPVRSYHKIWVRLPTIANGLAGRGVYVLSERARRSFDRFPDVDNDDQFVHRRFASGASLSVAGARAVVTAPATTRALVHRKVRVFAGNSVLRREGAPGHEASSLAWLGVVVRRPWLLVDVPAYVAITLQAKRLARGKLARGEQGWERDNSARAQ